MHTRQIIRIKYLFWPLTLFGTEPSLPRMDNRNLKEHENIYNLYALYCALSLSLMKRWKIAGGYFEEAKPICLLGSPMPPRSFRKLKCFAHTGR